MATKMVKISPMLLERPANKSQVEISDFLGRRKMQYKIKPLSISKLKRRPARWYRV